MALDQATIQAMVSQLEGLTEQLILHLNNRLLKTSAASNSEQLGGKSYNVLMAEIEALTTTAIEEFDDDTIGIIRDQITALNTSIGTRPVRTASEVITGGWTMSALREPLTSLPATVGVVNVALNTGAGMLVLPITGDTTINFVNIPALVNGVMTDFRLRVVQQATGAISFGNGTIAMSSDGQAWPIEQISMPGFHDFEITISRLAGANTFTARYLGSQIA